MDGATFTEVRDSFAFNMEAGFVGFTCFNKAPAFGSVGTFVMVSDVTLSRFGLLLPPRGLPFTGRGLSKIF